ncbi:MAG: molybdopterin cofactor-binding domain-containing protein [Bryobacteraceae bacterium]
MTVFAAYDIPNVTIDAYDVVVNKPSTAAYRAPGATNAAFATESVIDEIAEKLGLDPIDFRLRNAAKEGTRRADGVKYKRIGCVEVLEAMKNHPHYTAPLGGPNRGRGVAIGFWFNAGLPSSCTLSVNADGTVNLVEGSTRHRRYPYIHFHAGRRRNLGHRRRAGPSGASSIPTRSASPASPAAVAPPRHRNGRRRSRQRRHAPTKRTRRVALGKPPPTRSNRVGVSAQRPPDDLRRAKLAPRSAEPADPSSAAALSTAAASAWIPAGCIADVEVDPETGKTTIVRFTSVQDAGKAIHPAYVEGQDAGGSVQGIGWALNEEYFMTAKGHMWPTRLPRLPNAHRARPSHDRHRDRRSPQSRASLRRPRRRRSQHRSAPGALANAIYRAAGVRLRSLPMNPVKIMQALWTK